MKLQTLILISVFFLSLSLPGSFKNEQKKYSRVRTAYQEKEAIVKDLLAKDSIDISNLQIYIRIFKQEEKLEIWGKNASNSTYNLIKTYDICESSGELGPKRKQGDLQIPEGFYHIDRFNPYSNFYLSLGINYPNTSDKILGVKNKLGGDIFIHGNCVTIGCVPITDDKIKELYLFCIEAKDNGQLKIPVTIFPCKLTESNYSEIKAEYISDQDKLGLWTDLKKAFDLFEKKQNLPGIQFLENGRHKIN
jgi:murein L,D-transpeptidase YafK